MNTLRKIKFQWYNGNIKDAVPRGMVTIADFINSHAHPNEEILKVFYEINKAEQDGDKKRKARLKQDHLFYFTPSAVFKVRRLYDNIVYFTGLAQLDFDHVTDAVALRQYLFETYKQIVCCYLSPSGKGVKALIRISKAQSIDEYRKYYAGLINEFEQIDGFDPAPKNAALPLFLSADPDIMWREDFTIWSKMGKVKTNQDYQNLNVEEPVIQFKDEGYGSKGYFERITIEIFKKKLLEIVDGDGHPRLRSACLILGSRIGAGYLDYQTGLALAEFEVKSHPYFAKDMRNYLKTVAWAIGQGMNNPKYYS